MKEENNQRKQKEDDREQEASQSKVEAISKEHSTEVRKDRGMRG